MSRTGVCGVMHRYTMVNHACMRLCGARGAPRGWHLGVSALGVGPGGDVARSPGREVAAPLGPCAGPASAFLFVEEGDRAMPPTGFRDCLGRRIFFYGPTAPR